MTFKTKGLVLRSVKYGETSIVVTIYTEQFGIQTYMVNGVRSGKQNKSALYQPATLLQMDVYHNELKNIQRIKEAERSVLFTHLFNDVIRHSIALFIIELLQKTLKQPESNADLFAFCEDLIVQLDAVPDNIAANIPLYFALHLSYFYGFRIEPTANEKDETYLDLLEGHFTSTLPEHPHFIEGENAYITAYLLRILHLNELAQIQLNSAKRRQLLNSYMHFYALHIQDFGSLKTLQVLQEILTN